VDLRTTVDLRTQPCQDVIDRVERRLGVRLDREAAVVKRRSVGGRTDRDTWVRIEARPFSTATGQGSGVVPISQERVTATIEGVFPGCVETTVTECAVAHADLGWSNLTVPERWLLDWEDWGVAPRGGDRDA
jgi:hypothetical protein